MFKKIEPEENMNEPGIRHWVFGVIMLYGAVLVVWEMYRNWWYTDWERLFYDLFQYRSDFEEKMYKYDSEVSLDQLSDEYVRRLIQSIGNKRHG